LALSSKKRKKEPSSKELVHKMMNLKKTQIKMSSPSSLAKSTRCGETKVGLSREPLQEEFPETRRTKTKFP